MAKHSALAECH